MSNYNNPYNYPQYNQQQGYYQQQGFRGNDPYASFGYQQPANNNLNKSYSQHNRKTYEPNQKANLNQSYSQGYSFQQNQSFN